MSSCFLRTLIPVAWRAGHFPSGWFLRSIEISNYISVTKKAFNEINFKSFLKKF